MIFRSIQSGFKKIKKALAKTRSFFTDRLLTLFRKPLDEETLDELEQVLYEADLGIETVTELREKIEELHRKNPNLKPEDYLSALQEEILSLIQEVQTESPTQAKPYVLLIIGVNGNGKTTSCAKLAHLAQKENRKVLFAACDTYRAAASEQLGIWATRLNIPLVKGAHKSDPASVAFDAVTSAVANNIDTVIIDTAGRLQTREDLMRELEKIRKACDKVHPGAPHETLLVLDATIGQNAIDQAETFHKYTPLSGLILTKLDGTAKGGIVVNIQRKLGIPVKWIGIGETIEDLEPFDSKAFVKAIFE